MVYSLANYKMTITSSDANLIAVFGESMTIGGNGSQVGQFSVSDLQNQHSVQNYATGGYVFSKSYDRTGQISVQLNQMSDEVGKFKNLVNLYYGGDYGTLTIVLTNNENEKVVECIDCLPEGIPGQTFGNSASSQTWNFVVGKITIN